jgi:hypothetical protein
MKQEEVFKKIGGILRELNDQYEYLQTTKDELNDLELELFASNAHFLSDHLEILRKLNLQSKKIASLAAEKPAVVALKPEVIAKPEFIPKPEIAPKTAEKFFEPVVQQMRHVPEQVEPKPVNEPAKPIEIEVVKPVDDQPVPHIDLSSQTPEDSYSYMREEPETIRHELILDESMNWDDEDEPFDEVSSIEPAAEEIKETPVAITETKKPEPAPVSAYREPAPKTETPPAAHEVLTFNQKMSAQLAEKTASSAEQIKPIADLKSAITLNDKLLFVKELFNGYNLAYSEAIEILNRFNTFDEATRFLNTNYVTKNNWAGKPGTTEKFYDLLKRRYA